VDRTFNVHIPPGSQQGATQRVQGEGAPGRKGGPMGDLTVLLRVRPHPFYRQDGELLLLDLPLSPMTAALGSEVDVPLMDSVVRMKIPPGTQTGAMFRVRGRGLPRGHGARGDVHVVVNIEIPMDIPAEARAHLEALASHLTNDHFPRRKAFHAATQKAREKATT
jgi:molecular chaperone DnaJ